MADFPRNTNRAQSGKSAKNELSEYVFGKVQPQATALEEAVLGALMLDRDALSTVLDIISPGSFYIDAHKHIYEAMIALFLHVYSRQFEIVPRKKLSTI